MLPSIFVAFLYEFLIFSGYFLIFYLVLLLLFGSLSTDNDDAQGRRQVKNKLIFYSEIRDCPDLLGTPEALKTSLN